MTAGSILSTLFVAVSFGAGSAAAQALTLAGVTSGSPMRMIAEAGDAQAASPEIALGADVTAGFGLSASLWGTNATASGNWSFQDQRFTAQLHASCVANGAVAPGVAAHTGTPSVVVQLALSRPMVLRFVASVGVQSFGAAPRGIIDVGDDGVAEVDFTSPSGFCDVASKSVVLDLPAGSFPVRLQVEADLPSGIVLGNCLIASATAILLDRKSTRLNSSHSQISYAVFCLKKKKEKYAALRRQHQNLPTARLLRRFDLFNVSAFFIPPSAYLSHCVLAPLLVTHQHSILYLSL